MRRDPPVRPDGLCRQCRKPRKNAVRNAYALDQAIHDPFCARPCCEAWHGVQKKETDQQRAARKRAEAKATA